MKNTYDLVADAQSTVRESPLIQAGSAIRNFNLLLDVLETTEAIIQTT